MIVGVCADKGAPGVTTLATGLAMVWPGPRLLLEADPSGGDLAFRARRAEGGDLLAREPSVLSLAVDARTGLPEGALARYGQATTWGFPVVVGPPGAGGCAPLGGLWSAVAAEASRWSGVVIADLGRVQPGHPGMPVAAAAEVVLVVTRVSVEDLYHLRERVDQLSSSLGDARRSRNPVAVVALAPAREMRGAVDQVARMLAAIGSPIPVVGAVAQDPASAEELRVGQASRRLLEGALLRSVRGVADTLVGWWPALSAAPGPEPRPGPGGPVPHGEWASR